MNPVRSSPAVIGVIVAVSAAAMFSIIPVSSGSFDCGSPLAPERIEYFTVDEDYTPSVTNTSGLSLLLISADANEDCRIAREVRGLLVVGVAVVLGALIAECVRRLRSGRPSVDREHRTS